MAAGFGRLVVRTALYTTLLLMSLFSLWTGYVYFFKNTIRPDESTWNASKHVYIGKTWEYKYIPTNGIKLSAIEAKPPKDKDNGQLVILIHGFPESALLSWYEQIDQIANEGYLVVAPDMRGYNKSDKPADIASYQVPYLLADIVGIIDHYGKSKAVITGHDWGAAVAWGVAAFYPERVSKLAILNVPHPLTFSRTLQSSLSQIQKSWYMIFFQLPYLPEWKVYKDNFTFPLSALETSCKHGQTFALDAIPRYFQAWSEPGEITAMINYYRAAFVYSNKTVNVLLEQNPMITPPTLILWGKHDIALNYEMAQDSLKYCKNGRMITFDNATHWVQHDEPERVTKELLAFYKE